MHVIHELSSAVRTRRKEMGLSQQALAKLSGLSRSTVSQVENAKVKNLSLSRTASLLNVLGLSLTIASPHPRLRSFESGASPVELASRTASISYRIPLPPTALEQSLCTGIIPVNFEPHISTLLDEVPVSMIGKVVEQIHLHQHVPREEIWANMRRMASYLKVARGIWSDA